MPVRKESGKKQEKHQYEYEYLLRHIRNYLDENFGGVSNFLETEDCKICGFEDTPNERAKMFTYLSLPAEGEKVRVKSFPVLQKLYKGLLGIEIENKIKVVREQVLFCDTLL